ncbi:MAG: glutaminase [Lewinella sp.]|nr:glutaminase [Lewinella sp.]
MNYPRLLAEIYDEIQPLARQGQVADYIPELAKVDPDQFGIALQVLDEVCHAYGQSEVRFSIQSISKVFSVAIAFGLLGERLWERIHVEPAGTPFNSLVQLEYEKGIPRNPFINAGAIVVADILLSELADPYQMMLDFVRELALTDDIHYNPQVTDSEMDTGFRNAALAYLLKSFGNLENQVPDVLHLYFTFCSLEMSCRELAKAFAFFARRRELHCGVPNLTVSQVKRLNALMQTCGFYDEAGEFSFKVGLPGKSGVGGGIVAVYPGQYSVAVWSPRLNEKGNSVLGMRALELLTSKSGMSIF